MPRIQTGVIGYGRIGSRIVDLLLLANIQPVVIVRDPDKAKALEYDYYPAQYQQETRPIFTTNYHALESVDSVIVTSSAPIEVIANSYNRNSFIEYNTPIICKVAITLASIISKDALIVSMTNPVEGMLYALKTIGEFDPGKVLGVGTAVDAARYEALIAQALGVARDQVVSTVIGGHNANDSVFLPKCTKIAQLPLSHFYLSEMELLELENHASNLGFDIYHKTNQAAAKTPAMLAVSLVKAHLTTDAKRVVNCTMEVSLDFVNDMLGEHAIESCEPAVSLGVLALLSGKGAEPQKIPAAQIDTQKLGIAVRNIIKQQEAVRDYIIK
jgi:malate dehydrogenase